MMSFACYKKKKKKIDWKKKEHAIKALTFLQHKFINVLYSVGNIVLILGVSLSMVSPAFWKKKCYHSKRTIVILDLYELLFWSFKSPLALIAVDLSCCSYAS